MITNLEQVKAKACREVELPGWDEEPFIARLKPVSIFGMASQGKIPNSLLSAAIELFEGKQSSKGEKTDISKMGGLMDIICKESMVEPTFAEVGEFLTDDQRTQIFNYSQAGVKGLESFRKKSADNKSASNEQIV